jgi:hypothetical protein
MTTSVEFNVGKFGLSAVLRSAWSKEVALNIRESQCSGLELNSAKGWTGDDLSFLVSCPWLKALKIIDLKIKSVEPIHTLSELRSLEVITYCQTELKFSAFPLLEDCAIEWRSKATSLFDCRTLKSVFVNRYSGKDLSSFASLQSLESLAVLNAPVESLRGIESLKNLKHLRLANLRKLQNLNGLEHANRLEELDVHTCRKIESINEVASLQNLRKLQLNNDGDIASLSPLDSIDGLQTIIFYESTNIQDGDLSPLERQKNLIEVAFQDRRHYTHRRDFFGKQT